MKCNARFELANGEIVSPCCLEKDHDGDHLGTVLGSRCRWPQGFSSEEELYQATLGIGLPTESAMKMNTLTRLFNWKLIHEP